MSRDARKASVEAAFPFGDLDWPRRVVPGPDPFIEEERDRLLEYFLRKRWRVGRYQGRYQARPHFPYLAFLFTLFYTGMRPSERWRSELDPLTSAAARSSSSARDRSVPRLLQRPPPLRGW